ncbi:MAG: hypothetical protein LBF68_08370 [Christensenellaceae bacterium]|jgi:hypothetical protein|nr:hypothetical protein [Christensenellaceae bacterium]
MVKMRKIIRYALATLNIALFAILSSSCVSTKKPNVNGDDYNPIVSIIKQPQSSNMNVYVNKTSNATFSIPVIVDTDLSMFNTNTAKSNDKLYVSNIVGENIDDLLIAGLQYICFTADTGIVDATHRNFVCVFNFEVSPKTNWISKDAIRKVTQITFEILDSTISVPVVVNIFEKADDAKFIDECPILNNTQYFTLSERVIEHIDNNPCFNLALNWNIQGWGGRDWEDDNYATIVGFRFANLALQLEAFAIIVDNDEGIPIEETSVPLNLDNVNYDLTSRKCYWSGNFVEFKVTIVGSANQIVSDALIMQYTLNGGTEMYDVNLATVQLYNYDTLLSRITKE